MVEKPNQYRQALLAVEAAFKKWDEELTKSYPSSKADSLANSVGGSSWKSSKATEYADEVKQIVSSLTNGWTTAKEATKAKADPERDKSMVDEDSDEGWKAHFLEAR